MSLKGKTLFITGASRGIGLAIALKAARDGANIAIAAKTDKPHPKLTGTIFTAADEITKAGGNALPLVVDVRDGLELQSTGKVQGAKHVSRGMLEFKADPDSPYYDNAFDREKTVIVYCASGGRSALAGKTLQDMGYKDVRNLGGFKGWAESGGAVEKI